MTCLNIHTFAASNIAQYAAPSAHTGLLGVEKQYGGGWLASYSEGAMNVLHAASVISTVYILTCAPTQNVPLCQQ